MLCYTLSLYFWRSPRLVLVLDWLVHLPPSVHYKLLTVNPATVLVVSRTGSSIFICYFALVLLGSILGTAENFESFTGHPFRGRTDYYLLKVPMIGLLAFLTSYTPSASHTA